MKIRFAFITFAAVVLLGFASTSIAQQSSGKVFWYGTVDNKVHLVVQGISFEQRTVEGQPSAPGAHSFTAPLPSSDSAVRVLKLEGRGNRVTVVQQPNAANDFTAIIEVHDDRGGAGDYLIEISW